MTNTHTDSTSELFCLLVEAREREGAEARVEERVFTTPNPASSRRRCRPRRRPSRRCLDRHRNPCRPCRPCQACQACHLEKRMLNVRDGIMERVGRDGQMGIDEGQMKGGKREWVKEGQMSERRTNE